jgi:mycoredoxin-dependent peroxiredoxin
VRRVTLEVGDRAPHFTLRDQHGQAVSLSDFAGRKAVLLVFYPYAFSGVCTGELTGFRDRLGDFDTEDTAVLGISCDPMYSQRAFADRDAIFFPLLADFWPHGDVARSYGVLDEASGLALRGTFIVDKSGRVVHKVVNAIPDARDVDSWKAVLAGL